MGLSLDPRVLKRVRTIQEAACSLVIERGYDGFTMDELAETVGISRRTLFNYVSDKASAVLGPMEQATSGTLAEFTSGGPTGHLMADAAATIDRVLIDVEDLEPNLVEHHHLVETAVACDPKVAQLALERFSQLSEFMAAAVREREDWPEGDLRAATLAATFLAMIRLALDEVGRRDGKDTFRTVFNEVAAADRAVREMA